MIDVLTLAEEDTNLHRESVREQAGPCPNPQCRCQTDGFRVKWNGEKWVFMCRGCWDAQEMQPDKDHKRGWGDAIDYLRHYRGLSFQVAKALVDDKQAKPAPAPAKEDWQSETWQRKVAQVMHNATAAIWTPEGAVALEYAHRRGLSNETIKQFQLGYDARDDIPRLLIPSMNERRYVTVYRRDLRPDVPQSKRWKDAPGGTKSELYLADCLARKDYPVVLVEDAFSALSLWQECHDLVNVVATGGATCGKLTKWLVRLALAPHVLIALDADEDGDDESAWWLERLENARRLRPTCPKDANDMLQAGLSLSQWIASALAAPKPAIPGVFSENDMIPTWCKPDGPIWPLMVERYGLDETIRRVRAWYRDKKLSIPPGILRTQVAQERRAS